MLLLLVATTTVTATAAAAAVTAAAPRPRPAAGKRAYLWLGTERCCDIDPCADLFDDGVGRAAGFNASYFETLRPWAGSLTGLFINCGHTLSLEGRLVLPNATQTQRLRRAVAEFGALNVSIIPMILTHYNTSGLSLSALQGSSAAQAAFIQSAVSEVAANSYAGFNIDWEPCTGKSRERECGNLSSAAKWPEIPSILGRLRSAIASSQPARPHDPNFPVVSAAGYACDVLPSPKYSTCPYGNGSLTNATAFRGSDLILTSMGPYASSPAEFDRFLAAGVSNPGLRNFGAGLNTAPNTKPSVIPRAEIKRRFAAIEAAGVVEVDLFRMGPHAYGLNLLHGGWMEELEQWMGR